MKTSLGTSEETMTNAGVAQLVEPLIFDQLGGGSSPSTSAIQGLEDANYVVVLT